MLGCLFSHRELPETVALCDRRGAGAATACAGGGRFGEAKVEIEEEIGQKEQREKGAEDHLLGSSVVS